MTTVMTAFELSSHFKNMRIYHPRIDEVTRQCEGARKAMLISPDEPKGYMQMFAVSGSGKSHAIKFYIENVVVPQVIAEGLYPKEMPAVQIAGRQTKVLHVTLNENSNRQSLYADILSRLGADIKETASIATLRKQLYSYLRGENDPINNPEQKRPCDLLILDEIQHLSQGAMRQIKGKRIKTYETTGTDVTDALKYMMIQGMVPILFVGIPEAAVHLSVDPQLRSRYVDAIPFEPIRWSSPEEAKLFKDYCGKLGIMVHRHGLLPEVSNLLDHAIPEMLWAASGGLIGLATLIVERAVLHTQEAGKSSIGLEELAMAVDTRAIPMQYCLYNPFREGTDRSRKAT